MACHTTVVIARSGRVTAGLRTTNLSELLCRVSGHRPVSEIGRVPQTWTSAVLYIESGRGWGVRKWGLGTGRKGLGTHVLVWFDKQKHILQEIGSGETTSIKISSSILDRCGVHGDLQGDWRDGQRCGGWSRVQGTGGDLPCEENHWNDVGQSIHLQLVPMAVN